MHRFWLLSSTFYGTWMPGDGRGFVGRVRDARTDDESSSPFRFVHDIPGTPCDADLSGLERASAERMTGPPIPVERPHAVVLTDQFRETAAYRRWDLLAAAVMVNHVHLVVGVLGDPDPTKILGDFKSYGSRALSARFGKPMSGTWWTYGGSKRKLPNAKAVADAVNYVLHKQYNPLLTWSPASGVASAPREEQHQRRVTSPTGR
jgi:REP element-mobilizing transposase RayT